VIAAVLGTLGAALLVMIVTAAKRARRHRSRPASRSPRLAAGGAGQPVRAGGARRGSPVHGSPASSPGPPPTRPGAVSGWTVAPLLPPPSPSAPSMSQRPSSFGASLPDRGPVAPGVPGQRVPAGWRGWVVVLGIAGALATVGVSLLAGRGPSLLLLAVIGGALLVRRVAARRATSMLRAERALAAPAVIDLLGACLLAGLNPYRSLVRVAERSPVALRGELARAAAELDMGRTPAAALRAVGERTSLDELRAAAAALEAAERWGAPPAEALAARAEALRSRARMRAEAEAGRAAVRLAFPLVFCFLPAFVLLVVVPTMAGALRVLAP
jgi:Flp pilus assembly protein TadB